MTDEEGRASISENTPFSTYMRVERSGYYQSVFDRIDVQEPPAYGELTPRSYSFDVVLREKINPQALVAKRGEFKIPVKDEWIGYDLEASDWIRPHGTGENEDILIRYQNEFLGYNVSDKKLEEIRSVMKRWSEKNNKPWTQDMERDTHGNWSGKLEIKFPGEGEGIVKVVDSYLEHSDMKMPHLAHEEGYESSASWEGSMPSENFDLYQGYFLRLRVVKRGDEIIKANYAKFKDSVPGGKLTNVTDRWNWVLNDMWYHYTGTRVHTQRDWAAESIYELSKPHARTY